MRRQIRYHVFETNSSSVHSLTMCTKAEYDKWSDGEVWFDSYRKKFIEPFSPEEKYAGDIKNYYDNYNGNVDDMISDFMHEDDIWQSPEEYFDSRESCEPFEEYYTTPGGEEIVAFGYAGWDA